MFLDIIRRRNPALIEQAIALHQAGKLPANAYVIDLDAVTANARHIADEAARLGLKTYAMTKQMGRNGSFCRAVVEGGIGKAVAVDMQCAMATRRAGMRLGHLGHLVQIPTAETDAAASLAPDYWTVFSLEKAREAGAASRRLGRDQAILARLVAEGDRFYRGHEGGFPAADAVAIADAIDAVARRPLCRHHHLSLATLRPREPDGEADAQYGDAAARGGSAGARPGAAASRSTRLARPPRRCCRMLAAAGATQVEPGHGLTGTTPLHAVDGSAGAPCRRLSERGLAPDRRRSLLLRRRALYRSGVSRLSSQGDRLARADRLRQGAGTGRDSGPGLDRLLRHDRRDRTRKPAVGDSVVFGFRPQAFVTRAYTVGVSGLSSGKPVVETVYDAFGRAAGWPL